MLRRAVNWLAQKTKKAMLKLTDEDYNSHDLLELLSQYGNAYEINLRIFRQLQNTITGWPGGEAARARTTRPSRSRAVLHSPSPRRLPEGAS